MQELKAEKPPESPAGTDPVSRLMARLTDEGFVPETSLDEWQEFGEIIFRRREKIAVASGETVFIFTAVPELTERILRQSSESVVHTFRARSTGDKALSVLQATTVFHVLVSKSDQPHNDTLSPYITRSGGATFIPVIMVPEINQVLYPQMEEKVGSIRPRVEYLQYLIGERRETVNMHRQTIQGLWISAAILLLMIVAVVLSFLR
jgi:hypothetical protein